MPRLDERELFDGYEVLSEDPVAPQRPSRAPWLLLLLVLAAGAGAAGWLYWRLAETRGDAARVRSELADARTALDEVRAQRADLASRLGRAEVEKRDLLAVRDELSHDVQAKEEELAALRGEFDELQEKMKAEIEQGDVRLSQEKGRIKVDMVDEILFDVGDSSISAQGEEVLSRVGAVLARMSDKHIQVSGHTDDLPISKRLVRRFPTNWELSAARAITVVRFLEERAHVPGRRLVAAAHSQYDPISASKTASARARNRRIEILLTPEIDPDRESAAAVAPAPAPRSAATPPGRAPRRTTASRTNR